MNFYSFFCQIRRICFTVCMSVCLCACLSVCLSVFLSVDLALCFSLFPCLSLCLSVCLSVYLSVCLSVCLCSLFTVQGSCRKRLHFSRCVYFVFIIILRSRGHEGRTPQLSVTCFLIFMQFLAKIMSNNMLAPLLGLALPLGNPGSTTDALVLSYNTSYEVCI